MTGRLPPTLCTHSIGRRLSMKLAIFTMAVLSVLFTTTWFAVGMMIKERNTEDLAQRCSLLSGVIKLEARSGGETAVLARLQKDEPMRARTLLQVWRADGSLLYSDARSEVPVSDHHSQHDWLIKTPELPGGHLRASYTVDFERDAAIGRRWAWVLVLMTLAAGATVSAGARWHVRRQLRPLHVLAAQTRSISPGRLDQRLHLADPAEELRPWIDQFNALMGRLEQAYAQLEGFNADVAHELRTPLANLIGQTEVALSRERSADSLRDTLVSNLEEMQRLSAMVNDMLFLSQADRGAQARRGEPVSLAALAEQVLEFHEAPLEDAGLRWRVQGDARVPVDEPLFKRALSNLLGNATRYAKPGTMVVIAIEPAVSEAGGAAAGTRTADAVRVVVQNEGEPIEEQLLPRLFDRFFRGDQSRFCEGSEQHHGLGLAIVAAIARMHAGRTVAESGGGVTRVGFTLVAAPVA